MRNASQPCSAARGETLLAALDHNMIKPLKLVELAKKRGG